MTRQEPRSEADGQSVEAQRLAGLVLVRIAAGGGSETEVSRDLQQLVPARETPDVWRIELGRLVMALVAGGLVVRDGAILHATDAGREAAAGFLGHAKALPSSWSAVRDKSLLALALGLERAPARRQKLLAKAEGLRAQIVIAEHGLVIKGPPSPSRIRAALAVKALERAFGNQVRDGLGDKSSLPAKAGRLLAGQLSANPRDFGSDARLVAALAAEAVGVARADFKSLALAVLRRFVGGEGAREVQRRRPSRKSARKRLGPAAPRVALQQEEQAGTATSALAPQPVEAPATDAAAFTPAAIPAAPDVVSLSTPAAAAFSEVRPDPARFAGAVNAATDAVAEGWAGNRKAFISRVWQALGERHPEWGLTEIEFKCMLAEAHRTGLVVLANADLKDKRVMRELQESAVIYKNTVWHYVRAQN